MSHGKHRVYKTGCKPRDAGSLIGVERLSIVVFAAKIVAR